MFNIEVTEETCTGNTKDANGELTLINLLYNNVFLIILAVLIYYKIEDKLSFIKIKFILLQTSN